MSDITVNQKHVTWFIVVKKVIIISK